MDAKENTLSFATHENVHDDICVHTNITFDSTQSAGAFQEWGIRVRVKQPKTLMQFAITTPYSNSWKEWQDLLHEGKPLKLHESEMRQIGRHDTNLVFIMDPTDAFWVVPRDAVCPALEAALQEARRLQLPFFEDEDSETDTTP